MIEKDIGEIQRKFGLSYHVPYALNAEKLVGLKGKNVLEVGGSLPKDFVLKELEAKSWISIEEMGYWRESNATGNLQGTVPRQPFLSRLSDVESREDLGAFSVLEGRVENLPKSLFGRFDVIFSIAAFEHIDRMPLALDAMYDALVPGGAVFSMYSPIWSSHDGHHLPKISDLRGRVFDFSNSPIPPWGHLTMRPPELYEYLLKHTDKAAANEIVYYVYNSPHINRLFVEDYIEFFKKSKFKIEILNLTFPTRGDKEKLGLFQKKLEECCRGYKNFMNNGILVILRRPH